MMRAVCALLIASGSVFCQTPLKIRISQGQTADIWFGVNVAGSVNLAVYTRDGKNKIKLRWVTWGVGSSRELGEWGPTGSLTVPISWWKGVVSAKLRGQASSDTVVYISDKVEIDRKLTFDW